MSTQPTPEALRLADELESEFAQGRISNHAGRKAAAELRRLHALTQGTPATGGEPVGTVVRNTAADAQFAPRAVWPLNNFHDLPLGTKLYTSPQPVREPLTPEQIKDEASYLGFIGSTEALVAFVRRIEAAHGIKRRTVWANTPSMWS